MDFTIKKGVNSVKRGDFLHKLWIKELYVMKTIQYLLTAIVLFVISGHVAAQKTYCNPINLDYGYCPIPNFTEAGKHRATADPVITMYKGDYYLFSTNQWGYWWSTDLSHWNFVSKSFLKPWHKVYDDLCAPAVWVQNDTLLVFGSTYSTNFPIWMEYQSEGQ